MRVVARRLIRHDRCLRNVIVETVLGGASAERERYMPTEVQVPSATTSRSRKAGLVDSELAPTGATRSRVERGLAIFSSFYSLQSTPSAGSRRWPMS